MYRRRLRLAFRVRSGPAASLRQHPNGRRRRLVLDGLRSVSVNPQKSEVEGLEIPAAVGEKDILDHRPAQRRLDLVPAAARLAEGQRGSPRRCVPIEQGVPPDRLGTRSARTVLGHRRQGTAWINPYREQTLPGRIEK